MNRSNKHISADDLAKQGQEKRIKNRRKAKITKEESVKSSLNYRRNLDQRRVFLHISKWTDWKPIFILFCFMSASSIAAFLFVWNSIPSPSYFEPSGFGLMMGISTVFWFLCFLYSLFKIKSDVKAEKQWIDQLPFQLISYPDVLVYRSYPTIYFTINFERKKPDSSYLLNVLASNPYKITSRIEFEVEKVENDNLEFITSSPLEFFEESDTDNKELSELPVNATNVIFKFEMNNPRSSKFNRHRRWARKWIHEMCEIQFQAIHDKYPIKSVQLNDGVNELDFDWWIPRRNWWRFF